MSTLIHNIGLLTTPLGKKAAAGPNQGKIRTLENAWILMEDGRIQTIGVGNAPGGDFQKTIDAKQRLVTPGLVDAHTHLVFGGWRQHELAMKLHGMSYLDILKAGGGILSTVKATRKASEEELYEKAFECLNEMLSLGVTTCEIKSGYGLDRETELKQLRVIRKLQEKHPMDIAATYLGAHAVPEEYKDDREGYIRLMIDEVIPKVARAHLAEFCDVFCEEGVFTAEESERILLAGKKAGLIPKIHADEIKAIGGSELTETVEAISAEHLIAIQPSGLEAMSRAGTVACLLPSTSLYLGADYAPARAMIEKNIPIAVCSDFNPGSCPNLNLQLAMNLACLKYRLSPEEMLTAVTLNAACAISRGEEIGTVEVGKKADLVLWNAADLAMLGYRMGSNLVRTVIKNGEEIW